MAKFIVNNPWTKEQKVGDIYEADVLHHALRNHVTELKETVAPVAPDKPADELPAADEVPELELAVEVDGTDPEPVPDKPKGQATAKAAKK